jgi:hypothetical protein
MDRAVDRVRLRGVGREDGGALLLRRLGRVVAEAVAGQLDLVAGGRVGRDRRALRVGRPALDGRAHTADVLGVDLDEGEVAGGRVLVADERHRAELDAVDVAYALADGRDAVRRRAEERVRPMAVREVQRAGARVGLVVCAGLERDRCLRRRGHRGQREDGRQHDAACLSHFE